MMTPKTMGRGLAAGAQLALAAFISIGLTTTTHESVANTLSSVKTRAAVLAPSKEELLAADKTARLDKAMGALKEREASLYRLIFAAQSRSEWNRAEALIRQLSDKRLMGHVLADRMEKRGTSIAESAAWLEAYATLPQAQDIYDRAKKAGGKDLTPPDRPETWSGGGDSDGAANFIPELMAKNTEISRNDPIRALQKALHKKDPWKAHALLIEAQAQHKIEGTLGNEAQAAIGAAFFSAGERDQATVLTSAAAAENQPLGLWVRGLIAWEKRDNATAQAMFSRLSEHPSLVGGSRAAAHFWAYRAEASAGNKAAARKHLEIAASAPRSFYGLLAAQLLGRDPVKALGKVEDKAVVWGKTQREVLAANTAGWRALALIQVEQPARAQAELRRINPQGDEGLQQAMLALATYVPMPALALQIAQLNKDRSFDPALYPLLPWQPEEGYQVDRALLFAMARQESLFNPAAISHRGAQGLMQIMPATAGKMADNDSDVRAIASGDKLFDPVYNMALGQKYVQHLAAMPQIGNNLVLLLAAYNGGPGKVINLASGKDGTDPLLFLESMPVRETRNYVVRVLPHYWAYRARLGKPNGSLRQMAEGQWPTVSLTEDTAQPLRVAAVVGR